MREVLHLCPLKRTKLSIKFKYSGWAIYQYRPGRPLNSTLSRVGDNFAFKEEKKVVTLIWLTWNRLTDLLDLNNNDNKNLMNIFFNQYFLRPILTNITNSKYGCLLNEIILYINPKFEFLRWFPFKLYTNNWLHKFQFTVWIK